MKKRFLLISLLYITPLFNFVKNICQGITINFSGLTALDTSGMINIGKIADYQNKVEHMINFKIDKEHSLADYVELEEKGLLTPEEINILIETYKKRFKQISHKYFVEIAHIKPILLKLIGAWAQQRNRTDSLVLLWAHIEHGKEEAFVAEYVPSLKVFYTFLYDVDMLLNDIICSCPKTYAHYLECKKLVEEKHLHQGQ